MPHNVRMPGDGSIKRGETVVFTGKELQNWIFIHIWSIPKFQGPFRQGFHTVLHTHPMLLPKGRHEHVRIVGGHILSLGSGASDPGQQSVRTTLVASPRWWDVGCVTEIPGTVMGFISLTWSEPKSLRLGFTQLDPTMEDPGYFAQKIQNQSRNYGLR